jgi:DNA gyrase inhibitor GyrI
LRVPILRTKTERPSHFVCETFGGRYATLQDDGTWDKFQKGWLK